MPVLPSPSIHEAITPFGKSFEGSIPPLPPSKKAVVAAAAPSREEDASAAAASAASDAKKTTGQNRIAAGSQGGAAAGEPAEEDDVHLPEDEGGPRSSAPCRPPGDLGSRRGIPFPEQQGARRRRPRSIAYLSRGDGRGRRQRRRRSPIASLSPPERQTEEEGGERRQRWAARHNMRPGRIRRPRSSSLRGG
jgi:hypothetical protein